MVSSITETAIKKRFPQIPTSIFYSTQQTTRRLVA